VLEEQVVKLESRIKELEEPDDETAVRLHNPYGQVQSRPSVASPLAGPSHDISQVGSIPSPYSPSTASGFYNPSYHSRSASYSSSQPGEKKFIPLLVDMWLKLFFSPISFGYE
jgi:hypothetical protein